MPQPTVRRLVRRLVRQVAPLALAAAVACDRQPPTRRPAFADPRDSVAALARATFAGLPPLPCSSTQQDLAVTADGVGPVRVGALAAEVGRRCPSTDTVVVQVVDSAAAPTAAAAPLAALAAPGTPDPALPTARPQVRPPERTLLVSIGEGVLVATVAPTDTITRVVVSTPAFRTRGGMGVGSTVADLRLTYGRLCGTIDEGWVVLHAPTLPGVAFATSADYGEAAQRQAELQPRATVVPDTAHVVQLWAYGPGSEPCAAS